MPDYAELAEKYPEIIGSAEFRVLPGWFGILDDLCDQLMQLGQPYPRIRGVYEKFGVLTLHHSVVTDAQKSALDDARRWSQKTCENCGQQGNEPLRVCRRLQLLSKVEHYEQDNEQVFSGSA